jgi:hypothetical protein
MNGSDGKRNGVGATIYVARVYGFDDVSDLIKLVEFLFVLLLHRSIGVHLVNIRVGLSIRGLYNARDVIVVVELRFTSRAVCVRLTNGIAQLQHIYTVGPILVNS